MFVKSALTHCIDSCKAATMCGEVEVPEKHLDVCRTCNATGQDCKEDRTQEPGEGIRNADFIFYVSARQTERCHKGLTVAYAAHCQQEAALDRPIAGHANLCPLSISTKPQELETLLSTVKHEILHALGFSVSLYAFFRDEHGHPRTARKPDTGKPYLDEKLQIHKWGNTTIRKVVRDRWSVRGKPVARTIDVMVTPRVVQEARDHFDCADLEGAELEDQGGEGTALTHWEKRIFEVRPNTFPSVRPIWPKPLPSAERGDDGHPHAESGLLAHHAGLDGGLRLVQGQLLDGIAAQLGPRPRLRLREEELQRLDLLARRKVSGVALVPGRNAKLIPERFPGAGPFTRFARR